MKYHDKNSALRQFSLSIFSSALLMSFACSSSAAQHSEPLTHETVTSALMNSKVSVSLRARYEGVDQDGSSGASNIDATALTLKSRLSLTTGNYNHWSLGLEVDNVTAIIDDYNDVTLGYSGNDAVVADPELTDLNQAYLKYKAGKLTFTGGRQRILHNNQRFVGGVGWRQNEQTFDGYRFQYKASTKLSLDYSYIHNANRIFAKNSKVAADLSGDFHFINAIYQTSEETQITGFVYSLNFDNAHAMSSTTYGALYEGKFNAIFINASIASQSDNDDNSISYDATYINAEVGAKLGTVTILGGYEVLGSDDGKASFSTPFATLHKFQGFSDKFLGTGSSAGFKNGVEDTYITAKTHINGVSLAATYHSISANEGSADYGSELDIVASYNIARKYKLLVKYASYSADDLATDTNKLWIQIATKF